MLTCVKCFINFWKRDNSWADQSYAWDECGQVQQWLSLKTWDTGFIWQNREMNKLEDGGQWMDPRKLGKRKPRSSIQKQIG
jgi:hypothetical protein